MCVSAENEAPIRFRAVHVTPWTILFSLSLRQRTEMTSSARQDNTFIRPDQETNILLNLLMLIAINDIVNLPLCRQ